MPVPDAVARAVQGQFPALLALRQALFRLPAPPRRAVRQPGGHHDHRTRNQREPDLERHLESEAVVDIPLRQVDEDVERIPADPFIDVLPVELVHRGQRMKSAPLGTGAEGRPQRRLFEDAADPAARCGRPRPAGDQFQIVVQEGDNAGRAHLERRENLFYPRYRHLGADHPGGGPVSRFETPGKGDQPRSGAPVAVRVRHEQPRSGGIAGAAAAVEKRVIYGRAGTAAAAPVENVKARHFGNPRAVPHQEPFRLFVAERSPAVIIGYVLEQQVDPPEEAADLPVEEPGKVLRRHPGALLVMPPVLMQRDSGEDRQQEQQADGKKRIRRPEREFSVGMVTIFHGESSPPRHRFISSMRTPNSIGLVT